MVDFFSVPFLLLYSVLFGITMKIADLLNEHGLKMFKGSALLFGFLWGSFGVLIIISEPIVANIYFAITLTFILRFRIDYLNHGLATVMIIFAFLAYQSVNWSVLLGFFISISLFGTLSDLVRDRKKNKKKNFIENLLNLRIHYYVIPFIYFIASGHLLSFLTVSLSMISYEITLRIYKKKGYF